MPETIATLRRVPLFNALEDRALEDLAGRMARKSFGPGDYLFREGTPRSRVHVIASGEAEIVHGAGKDSVAIARLGAGNVVGEGAMLDDHPHSTSCRATVETTTSSSRVVLRTAWRCWRTHSVEAWVIDSSLPFEKYS